DYFTPNQKEAMKMTGTTDVWDAAECLSEYFEEVIIKLDKDGCLYLGKGQKLIVMPMMGVEAIDSTGAGDAFLSGFMYGLYHDRPIPECIACGNVTGGTCVQKVGCLTAFVTEEVLLKRAGEVSIRLVERGYHENNY
ncbi:MAG: PfkB family carbohydrate kinase, partial [Hespellia sp.]|nr:PfkB family carbohydrate kinase [Hespellia sp.]